MGDNSFPVNQLGGGGQNFTLLYPGGVPAVQTTFDDALGPDDINGFYLQLIMAGGTVAVSFNQLEGCIFSVPVMLPTSGLQIQGGNTVIDGAGNLYAQQIIGFGGPPIVTVDVAGSGAGAGADFSDDASPTNTSFRVRVNTTGTSAANARMFSIAFSQPFPVKPKVIYSINCAMGSTAKTAFVDATSITVNGFDFRSGGAAFGAGSWWIDFIVIA